MNFSLPKYGCSNIEVQNLLNSNEFNSKVKSEKKQSVVGFIGGPPCPDFSVAGKNRGSEGENGRLTKDYFNLIYKEEPHFFLFENVKGIWSTKQHREFLKKELSKLEKKYTINFSLLNALHFGVPQSRERVIVFGILKSNYSVNSFFEFDKSMYSKRYTNAEISNCDWPDPSRFILDGYKPLPKRIIEDLTVEYWFEKNEVNKHFNGTEYFKPKSMDKFMTIDEGDTTRKSFKRLNRWKYSPTAAYGNNEVHLHPYKARRLSVAEALSLQSLPKDFVLPKNMTLTDKFKSIGNGVPFELANQIAKGIRTELDTYFERSELKIV